LWTRLGIPKLTGGSQNLYKIVRGSLNLAALKRTLPSIDYCRFVKIIFSRQLISPLCLYSTDLQCQTNDKGAIIGKMYPIYGWRCMIPLWAGNMAIRRYDDEGLFLVAGFARANAGISQASMLLALAARADHACSRGLTGNAVLCGGTVYARN